MNETGIFRRGFYAMLGMLHVQLETAYARIIHLFKHSGSL